MAANVGRYLALGYTKFQLKIGGDVQEDIARILAVRELLTPKRWRRDLGKGIFLYTVMQIRDGFSTKHCKWCKRWPI